MFLKLVSLIITSTILPVFSKPARAGVLSRAMLDALVPVTCSFGWAAWNTPRAPEPCEARPCLVAAQTGWKPLEEIKRTGRLERCHQPSS